MGETAGGKIEENIYNSITGEKPNSAKKILLNFKRAMRSGSFLEKDFYNKDNLHSLFGSNYTFIVTEKHDSNELKISLSSYGVYYTEDTGKSTPYEKMIPAFNKGDFLFQQYGDEINVKLNLLTESNFSNIGDRRITADLVEKIFGKPFQLRPGYSLARPSLHYDVNQLEPKAHRLGSSWLDYEIKHESIIQRIQFRTAGNGDVTNISISIEGI